MADDQVAELRALTVRQPYAWAIAYGGKDVENRPRPLGFRGLLAIHAGKALYRGGMEDPRILEAIASREFEIDEAASRLGVVIAVADLIGCHDDATEEPRASCSPWAVTGQHHLMLRNPRPLAEPVPCKGKLGLWRLPEDVEKAVRAQLEDGHA